MCETKKCPYCGETIKYEARKCRYCGEWLLPKDSVVPNKEGMIDGEKKTVHEDNVKDVEESIGTKQAVVVAKQPADSAKVEPQVSVVEKKYIYNSIPLRDGIFNIIMRFVLLYAIMENVVSICCDFSERFTFTVLAYLPSEFLVAVGFAIVANKMKEKIAEDLRTCSVLYAISFLLACLGMVLFTDLIQDSKKPGGVYKICGLLLLFYPYAMIKLGKSYKKCFSDSTLLYCFIAYVVLDVISMFMAIIQYGYVIPLWLTVSVDIASLVSSYFLFSFMAKTLTGQYLFNEGQYSKTDMRSVWILAFVTGVILAATSNL